MPGSRLLKTQILNARHSKNDAGYLKYKAYMRGNSRRAL